MDEGEDEHDAQDGDEGVRGLPRQERVGVREVDGGALQVEVKLLNRLRDHLRVALLLHGDQGGQGVGEAKQLSLKKHVFDWVGVFIFFLFTFVQQERTEMDSHMYEKT